MSKQIWSFGLIAIFLAFQMTCNSESVAQIVSVNFHADDLGDAGSSNPAAHMFDGTEAAGITSARTTAWNNILIGNGGAGSGATIFATQSLSDDSGNSSAAVISSTLTAGTSSSWFIGYAASNAASEEELNNGLSDDNLFNSYLALNGPNGDGSPQDNFVLDVSGLGAEFTTNGYDLIIYSDTDRGPASNSDRTCVFAVTPSGGSTVSVLTEDDGSVDGVFNGSYILSDNSDTNDTFSNYTVLSNLTAASFSLEITSPGGGGRGGISGFQIVANDETDPTPPPSGPNVVLFVVDDMGWSDWERRSDFYITPNMTRLAARGMEFTNGYSSCSVCSPTRASLMTGLSPAVHRITKWIPGNPDNEQTNDDEPLSDFNLDQFYTIADAMSDAGYRTAHLGKWHLGQPGNVSADPLNFGFDFNIGGSHIGGPGGAFDNPGTYENYPGMDASIDENYLTDHLGVEAENFINSRVDAGEKFFMNFNTYAVHTPIIAHPDHIDEFNNLPPGSIHDNAGYASMLRGMDKALGTILDTLEDRGIMDDTVIIFVSDHGGHTTPQQVTSNFPLRGGKGQQWEGGHRVPLIVAGPGIPEGVVSEHQSISHDLYPTILDLAGVEGDPDHNQLMDGVSFADVLVDSASTERDSMIWHFPHESNHSGGPYGVVVNGDYKFIEVYDTGQQLLFNIAQDVGEQDNLINDLPDMALSLRMELHNYLRDTDAVLWAGNFELLPLLGDVNCDGTVNLLDVQPFVDLVSSGVFDEKADTNQDGFVNLLDVQSFIALLVSGG